MRLIVRASVDQGAIAGRHLYHCTVIILSEGIRCQIDRSHIIRPVYEAGCISFTRKVNACLGTEAKNALVFCKLLFSFQTHNIHHNDIA